MAAADLLYVWTGSQTGKAKRIGNNAAVTLPPCTRRGTVPPAVPAQAVIVSVGERPDIGPLFAAKHRLQLRAIVAPERLVGLLRSQRSPRESERIYVQLAVTTACQNRPAPVGFCSASTCRVKA